MLKQEHRLHRESEGWVDELDGWEIQNQAAIEKLRMLEMRLAEYGQKYARHRQALVALQQDDPSIQVEPSDQARRLVLEAAGAAEHKSLNSRRLAVMEALEHLSFLVELPD